MSEVVSPIFGSCPLPIFEHKQIVLGHGSGGKLTAELIDKIFRPAFANPILDKLDDQAVVQVNDTRLAFTTDSFVVTPIFFPGGDIGRLAVNGTVNDLAMCGARPLYLAAAFILEEGLAADDLRRVVESMRDAASEAGVLLVTGDTKVVNRGKGDQVFITTTGLGVIDRPVEISADRARPGDKIILRSRNGDYVATGEPGVRRRHRKRLRAAARSGQRDARSDWQRRASDHSLPARSNSRWRSNYVE